jgi:hypothetical protein
MYKINRDKAVKDGLLFMVWCFVFFLVVMAVNEVRTCSGSLLFVVCVCGAPLVSHAGAPPFSQANRSACGTRTAARFQWCPPPSFPVAFAVCTTLCTPCTGGHCVLLECHSVRGVSGRGDTQVRPCFYRLPSLLRQLPDCLCPRPPSRLLCLSVPPAPRTRRPTLISRTSRRCSTTWRGPCSRARTPTSSTMTGRLMVRHPCSCVPQCVPFFVACSLCAVCDVGCGCALCAIFVCG